MHGDIGDEMDRLMLEHPGQGVVVGKYASTRALFGTLPRSGFHRRLSFAGLKTCSKIIVGVLQSR